MKGTLSILALAIVASSAMAQVVVYDNLSAPSAAVSGFTTSLTNTGATAGSFIGQMTADDITPISGFGGAIMSEWQFTMLNTDTVNAVSVRPRVRIYDSTGAGGGPGTVLAAVSFNPISIAANSYSIVTGNMTPNNIALPSGTFWFGIVYDSVGSGGAGNTGATAAQVAGMGQVVFNGGPTIGSSANQIFTTTAAGSATVSFASNSPAGTIGGFVGGSPVANMGIKITVVPEPATMTALALGGLALLRRKRAK
ncbi:MAG: PEP-CTERM sorting domain-containing protein [Armatimonadetes bacterium]|nr:PEP-CTERM sorting domain-containing protein [Armatimonadota bacterium]